MNESDIFLKKKRTTHSVNTNLKPMKPEIITRYLQELPNILYPQLMKPVTNNSQGNHTGQLDYCKSLADDNTTG